MNTGVDWLAFAVLHEIFGLLPRHAQIIAMSLAVINSYIVNKNWTFKNNKKYRKSEMLKFLAVQGTSLCIGYAGMFLLHDMHEIPLLNPYLCKILIAFITILINYFGNKIFVFK
jgi:putative flippase GtrA